MLRTFAVYNIRDAVSMLRPTLQNLPKNAHSKSFLTHVKETHQELLKDPSYGLMTFGHITLTSATSKTHEPFLGLLATGKLLGNVRETPFESFGKAVRLVRLVRLVWHVGPWGPVGLAGLWEGHVRMLGPVRLLVGPVGPVGCEGRVQDLRGLLGS